MQHEFQIVFVPLMLCVIDIASGYVAAIRTGTVNSTVMFNGMWNKMSELFAIVVGKAVEICISIFGADFVGTELSVPVCTAVCAYLSLYEITSIVENIGKMNPTIGKWLIEHIGIEPYKVNQSDNGWYDDSDIK